MTMKQSVSQAPSILNAEHQYRSLLLTFPQSTEEHLQSLNSRALAGENVRDEMIFALQRRVYNRAYRLAAKYMPGKEQALERLDLVQEANKAMLRWFQPALTKDTPSAYLLKVAQSAMFDCIRKIETTHESDEVLDLAAIEILLESASKDETTNIQLYQAIKTLPEKQRLVIRRHYGIGCAPESLNAISREISPRSPKNAHERHKKALIALQQMLEPTFPWLMSGGTR